MKIQREAFCGKKEKKSRKNAREKTSKKEKEMNMALASDDCDRSDSVSSVIGSCLWCL